MAQTLTNKGWDDTAFETKVILKMLANQIAMAESLEQAYTFVADAANVEGLDLPSYEEVKKKFSGIAKQKTTNV